MLGSTDGAYATPALMLQVLPKQMGGERMRAQRAPALRFGTTYETEVAHAFSSRALLVRIRAICGAHSGRYQCAVSR